MRKIAIMLLLCLCLSTAAGALSDAPEFTAAPGQVNPYKTRSELLMDAAAHTGVVTPEEAAAVWAQGLEMRSAALQYVVMTEALKAEYAAQLDVLHSNWVTGVSSPWVAGYALTKTQQTGDTRAEISLSIETVATYSPSAFYEARLWLVREGPFWRIERIWADEELYPYTLYRP